MNGDARPHWEPVLLLPALTSLPGEGDVTAIDAGLDGIAVATSEDARVREYLTWSETARQLFSRFRSRTGTLRRPSAILVRRDLLESLGGDPTPIIAFRNLVALSHVLPARSAGRPEGWSDLFDISPAHISRSGDRVDIQTQAERAIYLDVRRLDIRPPLGSPTGAPRLVDELLLDRLARCWKRLYIQRRDIKKTEPVFRPLEVAFHATSTEFKNFSSLFDAGIGAVLWVSACEILARPTSSKVDKTKVQDLLMKYNWPRASKLSSRWYRSYHQRKRRSVDRASKIYEELYEARNDFAHGNPVRNSVLLSRVLDGQRLLGLASTIYRTALISYLEATWPRPTKDDYYALRSAIVEATYSQHLEGSHGWS